MRIGAVDDLLLVRHVRLVEVQVVLVLLYRRLAHVAVELEQHAVDLVGIVCEVLAGQQQRHADETQPEQVGHVPADSRAGPRQVVSVPSETGGYDNPSVYRAHAARFGGAKFKKIREGFISDNSLLPRPRWVTTYDFYTFLGGRETSSGGEYPGSRLYGIRSDENI